MKFLSIVVFLFVALSAFGTNYYWVGISSNNWNDGNNWAFSSGGDGGAGVPGSSDVANFDHLGNVNCTINANVNVAGLKILNSHSGAYTSTVTQGSYSVTIGSTGVTIQCGTYTMNSTSYPFSCSGSFGIVGGTFTANTSSGNFSCTGACSIAGGTFNCSSATGSFNFSNNLSISSGTFTGSSQTSSGEIDIGGNFSLSGGTFTASAYRVFCRGNATRSSGTFNNNSGEFRFQGTNAISLYGVTLYDLYFYPFDENGCTVDVTSDLSVTHLLTFGGQDLPVHVNSSTSNVINLTGNLTLSNNQSGGGGTGKVVINGSGSQTITGNSTLGKSALCNVEINHSGTLLLYNYVTVAGDVIYTTTTATLTPGTSTLVLTNDADNSISLTMPGTNSPSFKNITFSPSGAALTATLTNTLTATGTITLAGGSNNLTLNSGVLEAKSHVTITNTGTGGGGSTLLLIDGTSSQTLTGSGTSLTGFLGDVTVSKSGTLTLSSTISIKGNLTRTSGTISPGASTLVVLTDNSLTFSGTINTYNLTLFSNSASTLTVTSGTTSCNNLLTVSGSSPLAINSGTIKVTKNIAVTNTSSTGGGTGTIYVYGSTAQTITGRSTGTMPLCNVSIEKYNISGSNNLTLDSTTNIGGNLTIVGHYFDSPPSAPFQITAANSGKFKLLGDLNFNDDTFGGSGAHGTWLGGGSATIELYGSTNAAINGYTVPTQTTAGVLPSILINKTSSTDIVSLYDNIPIQGNLTYSVGTINAGSSTIYMYADGATSYTINTGSQTINNLKVGNGNTISSGAVNAGSNLSLNGNLEIIDSWTNRAGSSTAQGNFSAGTYSVTLLGDWTDNGQAFTYSTSTVTFAGSGTQSVNGANTTHPFYNVTVAPTSTYTLDITSGHTASVANNLILAGGSNNLYINAGTLACAGNLTVSNTGSASGGSGTILFNGGVGQTLTGNNGITSGFLPNVTVSKSGGTLTLAQTVGIAGNMTLTSGTFSAGSQGIGIKGDWTDNSGTVFNAGTGLVTFLSSKDPQYINGTVSSQTFNDVEVNKTTGKNLSFSGSTTTMNLKDIILTSGVFNAPTTINITGDWTHDGGTFSPGSGTVNFNGVSTNQVINGSATTESFNDVTINMSGGYTLSTAGSISTVATNDLTQTSGNFTAPETLNITNGSTASLTITSGTLTAGSNISINGDWTDNSTFSPGTGTVTFTSPSGDQLISRSSGSETFYNLALNLTTTTDKVNFSCPLIVSNNGNFLNGVLKTTGPSLLTFNDDATATSASNSSYVHSGIIKIGNDPFVFPLGSSTLGSNYYHPLEISSPSPGNTTDEYYASYTSTGQAFTSELDNQLESISNCEYWNVRRLVGTSDVTPTLYWNTTTCSLDEEEYTSVAYWDSIPNEWDKLQVNSTAGYDGSGNVTSSSDENIPFNISSNIYLVAGKEPTAYASLVRKLDAAYYATINGKLRFKYDEEYLDKDRKLSFEIFKTATNEKVFSDGDITQYSNLGDNRYLINLNSYSTIFSLNNYYTLVVTNEKNEKRYLRFKYITEGF